MEVGDISQGRYRFFEIVFATAAFLIFGQLVRIQFSAQARGLVNDEITMGEWRTVYPARGVIYDRWGHVLAGNTTVYEVGAELRQVENPDTIALTLMGVVQVNYDEVLAAARQEFSLDPKDPAIYAVLADYVTPEQKEHIEELSGLFESQRGKPKKGVTPPSLRGLVYRPHYQRSYPEGEVASTVLGFVNRESLGFFGIEEYFNDVLAGTPKNVWMPLDPNKMDELPYIPNGSSLILTIDREIQASMEELLDDAIDLNGAAGGVIAVMDPETGEILAMASQPRLDINRFWEYEDVFPKKVPFNRAVSEDYEPGSVFKVLTMAAALDSNSVKPDTQFLDTGMIEVGGVFIYNWNRGVWGWQDMTGCLQHSLNVCLAWVATQIGASRFYEYMQKFGLGHITGIDLAGEVPGRLKLPGDSDWYEADLGTNAFGQGISVTPVQMLMALSAIANDGEMVVPHVLKAMVTEGRQYVTPNPVVGRPISAKTAHVLNEMLATSLEVESSNALVEGYRVAGKTGTAEIATPEGYTSELTNASFAGWGPVDDPRFIVYVWLEKPTSSPWGSVVAAPIFKQAVERLVILMNIPPDDVRIQMSKH
jgi:cell division protein FtsI/penicillin-binding protein 2